MEVNREPVSEVYLEDCMVGLKRYEDKFFDLAIVDPPYGIGADGMRASTSKHGGRKPYKFEGWDNKVPDEEYFTELFRVSKNQIIWGANYFTKFLPPSMGWIFWDKGQRICNSDGELAYTSFNRALRCVVYNRVELQKEGTIHPTQKPIVLYKWLLKNYAECEECHGENGFHEDVVGDGGSRMYMECESCGGDFKILDTHLGSGSLRIAAHQMGFHFTAFENNQTHYAAQEQRFQLYKSQLKLF